MARFQGSVLVEKLDDLWNLMDVSKDGVHQVEESKLFMQQVCIALDKYDASMFESHNWAKVFRNASAGEEYIDKA